MRRSATEGPKTGALIVAVVADADMTRLLKPATAKCQGPAPGVDICLYYARMSEQPRAVLGEVLRRAREGLSRSPEQVGALVGISGRTVRRLEVGEADSPRRVTLDALAGFY